MQAQLETLSPVKKRLVFEVPAERVTREIDAVYEKIRSRVSIKGFRKGKAPAAMIEQHYSDVMSDDVLKNLFNETFFPALQEHKLYPIAQPTIEADAVKRGEPLKYSATFEVMPEVTLQQYLGLEIKRPARVPVDAEVERRLEEMRTNMAQLEPVAEPRPIQQGDFVTFDFTGYVDGAPLEHGAAEDFRLEIGSGQFIPGFEEKLVGLLPDTESSIDVTFPENYHAAELAGKEATFKVRIKSISVRVLPELNDEFAQGFGEFTTFAELQAQVVEYCEKQQTEKIDRSVRDQLIDQLVANNAVEVPEALVTRQLEQMLENAKHRLQSQRLTLEMVGMDAVKFAEQYRDAAVRQLRGELLLDAVAAQEQVEVTDEEIEAELQQMATNYNQPLEAVKGYFAKGDARTGLVARLREDKVVAWLTERATVTEVPASAEQE